MGMRSNHRRIGAFLLTGLLAVGPVMSGAAAEPAFVPGTADVPLMEGLTAIEAESLVFDKPDGRLVQAVAQTIRGAADPAAILAFYARTLPQLGWASAGPGRWRREGEELEIRVERAGGRMLTRFVLSPQEGAPQGKTQAPGAPSRP